MQLASQRRGRLHRHYAHMLRVRWWLVLLEKPQGDKAREWTGFTTQNWGTGQHHCGFIHLLPVVMEGIHHLPHAMPDMYSEPRGWGCPVPLLFPVWTQLPPGGRRGSASLWNCLEVACCEIALLLICPSACTNVCLGASTEQLPLCLQTANHALWPCSKDISHKEHPTHLLLARMDNGKRHPMGRTCCVWAQDHPRAMLEMYSAKIFLPLCIFLSLPPS